MQYAVGQFAEINLFVYVDNLQDTVQIYILGYPVGSKVSEKDAAALAIRVKPLIPIKSTGPCMSSLQARMQNGLRGVSLLYSTFTLRITEKGQLHLDKRAADTVFVMSSSERSPEGPGKALWRNCSQ